MIRLETVEDFEKVRKALVDPSSYPRQYCIRPYSYCFPCDEVKEFEAPCEVSQGESIFVKCLGCDNITLVQDPWFKNNIYWGMKFGWDKLREEFLVEMKHLNSKKMQIKFFAVELEHRITREKSELRKVQNRIQKFARLRP